MRRHYTGCFLGGEGPRPGSFRACDDPALVSRKTARGKVDSAWLAVLREVDEPPGTMAQNEARRNRGGSGPQGTTPYERVTRQTIGWLRGTGLVCVMLGSVARSVDSKG